MTSLRQLFGSLKDERRDPESIGRLRVQEMDADMIPNYGPEGDDLEEYDMEYDLKQIHPYVALWKINVCQYTRWKILNWLSLEDKNCIFSFAYSAKYCLCTKY